MYPEFCRALNYGSIGSILAHEITHGFDDVGRHFDEDGNKNLWWTNSTISKFVNRYQIKNRGCKRLLNDESMLFAGQNVLKNNTVNTTYRKLMIM